MGFEFINVTGKFEEGVGIKEAGVGILSCQTADNGIAVNPDGYQLHNKNGGFTIPIFRILFCQKTRIQKVISSKRKLQTR